MGGDGGREGGSSYNDEGKCAIGVHSHNHLCDTPADHLEGMTV